MLNKNTRCINAHWEIKNVIKNDDRQVNMAWFTADEGKRFVENVEYRQKNNRGKLNSGLRFNVGIKGSAESA